MKGWKSIAVLCVCSALLALLPGAGQARGASAASDMRDGRSPLLQVRDTGRDARRGESDRSARGSQRREDNDRGGSVPQRRGGGMGLDEAVARAQRQTGGRVLSADTIESGDHVLYRIKVLTPQGQVRIVTMDAGGGR